MDGDVEITAYDSPALAGAIGDLCHVLGLNPNEVARISIQPGYVTAEVWLDEVEPRPGYPGLRRKAVTRGWTYPLPVGHALRGLQN